ncbi:MAG: hypothetical protein FWD58_06345 [Firmicutes bacterium]|nr:hypothetical protein [Bacillota bacterium]
MEQQYNTLPKEQKRELRKEYFNVVNPRAKKLRRIGIFLLVPTFVALGFSMYYLISFLLTYKLAGEFFLATSLYFVCLLVAVPFPFSSFGGLWRWLWREKNILSYEWPNTKKTFDFEPKLYAELPKNAKWELFKEYLKSSKRAKAFLIVGLICCASALAAFGMAVHDLFWIIFNRYTGRIWYWTSLTLSSGSAGGIFVGFFVYERFRKWAEYEKNIVA